MKAYPNNNDIKGSGRSNAAARSGRLKKADTTVKSNRLKILITIVNRRKSEFYMDLIQSFDVNMQLRVLAEGTANAEILEQLGLSDNEKAVIISVITEENAKKCLMTLEDKFKTIKDGKGIAYTIPMSSLIGVSMYKFLSNKRDTIPVEVKK